MNYNDITQRYFEGAVHAGSLQGPGVMRGRAGDREQGTAVQFEVQLQDGCVRSARFQAFGCPHTLAVCAFLAERAEGAPLPPELPEGVEALMRRFDIPPAKRGRLLVVEDAWRALGTLRSAPTAQSLR